MGIAERGWLYSCGGVCGSGCVSALSGNSTLPIKVCARFEAEPTIPQGLQTEIVLILAGMLLHGYQETCT